MMEPLEFTYHDNNLVELYRDGQNFDQKFIALIDEAKEILHLQVYLFELDQFGKKVFQALLDARKRGVELYILLDAVGSKGFDETHQKELKDVGAHFCLFNGIKFERLIRWGRRLHHKILLVDDIKAMVGGINIVSPYVEVKFKSPRLDFAVYLEGPVTTNLAQYCQSIFVNHFGPVLFSGTREPISHSVGHKAQVSVNDWMQKRIEISRDYLERTEKAQNSITLINSYFFPRRKFMQQLGEAARRGVKVRVILAKYSDWPSWILASEYLYSFFFKHNIEVYLWNKSILHGKIAVIDRSWSTIGSFNLNYTSYQGNIETNIDVDSTSFGELLEKTIDGLIEEGCEKVDPKKFFGPFGLVYRYFFYLLLSVISNFSLAFVFQPDGKNPNLSRIASFTRVTVALACIAFGLFGLVVPGIAGIPFLFFGFFLLSRQVLLNKGKEF